MVVRDGRAFQTLKLPPEEPPRKKNRLQENNLVNFCLKKARFARQAEKAQRLRRDKAFRMGKMFENVL